MNNLLLIDQIRPTTRQPWTAQVVVLEKGFPRDPVSSPNRYQRLMLADTNGTRVQATIFGRDIETLRNTLLVMRTYTISNAVVRFVEPRFRNIPNEYQWTITSRTIIEEVEEGDLAEAPQYAFVGFPNLGVFRNTGNPINVLGAAVRVLPPRTQSTDTGPKEVQEVLLLDSQFRSVRLTLWNQFVAAEGAAISATISHTPVVAGMRIRVVSFNGMGLSTRSNSCLLINPTIEEAIHLRNIIAAHPTEVQAAIEASGFGDQIVPQAAPEAFVGALVDLDADETYRVQATVTPIRYQSVNWYMGCSNCFRATSAVYMERFTCFNCTIGDTHALPRARVEARLEDVTGTLDGTFFGPDAERLVGCTTDEIYNATVMENGVSLAQIMNTGPQENQTVLVRISMRTVLGQARRRYTFTYPRNMPHQLPDELPPLAGPAVHAEQFMVPLPAEPDANIFITPRRMLAFEEIVPTVVCSDVGSSSVKGKEQVESSFVAETIMSSVLATTVSRKGKEKIGTSGNPKEDEEINEDHNAQNVHINDGKAETENIVPAKTADNAQVADDQEEEIAEDHNDQNMQINDGKAEPENSSCKTS